MNTITNGQIIQSFSQALLRGESALTYAPGLLKRIIKENMWQKYYDDFAKEEYTHTNFMSFITSKPREGLGETLENVKKVCRDDMELLSLIDELIQRPAGGGLNQYNKRLGNNITEANRPNGDTVQKALRRLRKDRPDLHEQVITNKLTAHAAMLQAGFRKKTVSVPIENIDKCLKYIKKYFTKEEIIQALNK
jgi:ribosomal protein S21